MDLITNDKREELLSAAPVDRVTRLLGTLVDIAVVWKKGSSAESVGGGYGRMNHRDTEAQGREERGESVDQEDRSFDSLLQDADVEIQEEAEANLAEFQVRQELRLVDRGQSFDGFQLDEEAFRDDDIHDVITIKRDILVMDRELLLPLKQDVVLPQFITQTFFLRRLQQSRPEHSMNLDCRSDHPTR
nr:hypothetical protein [Singulisphaera sp. GP187]